MNEQGLKEKEPYKRLAEINRALTTSLNFDRVLDLIVENAAYLVDASVCLLLLVDKEGRLRMRASKGVDAALLQSFSGIMEEDVIRQIHRMLGMSASENLVSVPIITKDSLDGLLVIAPVHALNEEEEWQLSALADQAAIALRNARLYEMELAEAGRERDETLEALRLSNERISSILESITDLFFFLDRDWRFVDANRRAETRFGKNRQELIGEGIWEVFPEAINTPLFPRFREALDQMKPVHFEVAPGIVPGVWFEIHAYPSADGLSVYLRDITERKRSEVTNQLLASIVESSEDAIISKNLDGIIMSWNKGAEHIYGYTAEEAIGQPITMLIPQERFNDEPAILQRIRSGKKVDHYETIRRRKDGSLIDISLTVSPIKDESGEIVGASKIARDISERKRGERERTRLLESERMARSEAETANRLKDEFLATLSHELRNPLNVILGYAEVLLRSEEADRSPLVKRAADILKRNAVAQSQLIRDLLDLSRLHMGKLSLNREAVSLITILNNAVETVRVEAGAKDIDLEVELPEDILFVDADPLRIEQVVWNLLNNAVKFTPSGGTVTVRLRAEDEQAALEVQDTGQGIDPAFLPHVFEMFRQADATKSRRHGGLGIGLALVQQLVHLHDGTVEVFSDGLGSGARFTVRLPLRTVSRESRTTKTETERGVLGQLRILVVDDSHDTIEMLRRLFEMDGATVMTAANGPEALELIEQKDFDVILSDISMPGMDGFELLRRVRALPGGSEIPVLALTGFGRAEDVEKAKKEGFFSHVTKPIDIGELIETIKSVPSRKRERVAKT